MLQGVSLYCAKSTRWCDDNKRHICKPFIYPHDSFLNWPKRFSGHFSSERNIIFASKTHFVSFFYKKFRVCFVWQENTPFPSHIINFGNDIQNVYEFIYANFVKCNKLPKQNENDSWERNRKGITVLGTNNICENDGGIHWPKNGTNAENDVTFAETTKPNNDDKLMFDAIFRLFISP